MHNPSSDTVVLEESLSMNHKTASCIYRPKRDRYKAPHSRRGPAQ